MSTVTVDKKWVVFGDEEVEDPSSIDFLFRPHVLFRDVEGKEYVVGRDLDAFSSIDMEKTYRVETQIYIFEYKCYPIVTELEAL